MNKTSKYISSTSSYSSSLDSQTHNRNRFCKQWSVHGPVHEQEPHIHECLKLRCKGWHCTSCGPRKARQVRRAIIEQALENRLSRLLTLTLDPSRCTPEQSIPRIRTCWNKFRTYLTRQYGTAISFISVLELQQSGYAHLHVLVDRFISQAWISDAWHALGGGRIVDIRYVDVHRVSAYLSKYLTKEMLLAGFKKRQRRYTTSRNITLLKRIKSEGWGIVKAPLEYVRHHYQERILQTCQDDEGKLQSFVYWDPVGMKRVEGSR